MYKIESIEKKPGSLVEIKLIIEKEEIEKHRKDALEALNQEVKMDGFRPGKIPEKTLIQKVGELTVLEEALRISLNHIYAEIIEDKKIKAIGYPKITITKIAVGEDVSCTIKTAVIPEIILPDYKKIAGKIYKKTEKKIETTDEEVEKIIQELKDHRAKIEKKDVKEIEVDNDFLKTLGDFKDIEDFKLKIKENIRKDKEQKSKERKRIETLTEIIKESKIEIPEILTENELKRMKEEFSHELQRAGTNLEDYKKKIGKTDEDIKKEWEPKALERVKSEFILMKIAEVEKIIPEKEKVEKEVKALEAHYKDAPKEKLTAFVEDVLTKQGVFEFLEKQGA